MKIKKLVKRVVAVIAAMAMIMESTGIASASSLNKTEDTDRTIPGEWYQYKGDINRDKIIVGSDLTFGDLGKVIDDENGSRFLSGVFIDLGSGHYSFKLKDSTLSPENAKFGAWENNGFYTVEEFSGVNNYGSVFSDKEKTKLKNGFPIACLDTEEYVLNSTLTAAIDKMHYTWGDYLVTTKVYKCSENGSGDTVELTDFSYYEGWTKTGNGLTKDIIDTLKSGKAYNLGNQNNILYVINVYPPIIASLSITYIAEDGYYYGGSFGKIHGFNYLDQYGNEVSTFEYASSQFSPDLSEDGRVFDGWYLDKELTVPFNLVRFEDATNFDCPSHPAVENNSILYAKWHDAAEDTETETPAATVEPTSAATLLPVTPPVPTATPYVGDAPVSPTIEPTAEPTIVPTIEPTAEPIKTSEPTIVPTVESTAEPIKTSEPTIVPTVEPTDIPMVTEEPSVDIYVPVVSPTVVPTVAPTITPQDNYSLEYGVYKGDDEEGEDAEEDNYDDEDEVEYQTFRMTKNGITAAVYTDGEDGEVTLSWKKVKKATRYEVWTKDGEKWKKLITTKKTKYFDDVDEDTTYRIIAKRKVGKKWKKLKTRKIKVTL